MVDSSEFRRQSQIALSCFASRTTTRAVGRCAIDVFVGSVGEIVAKDRGETFVAFFQVENCERSFLGAAERRKIIASEASW